MIVFKAYELYMFFLNFHVFFFFLPLKYLIFGVKQGLSEICSSLVEMNTFKNIYKVNVQLT